MTGTLLRLAVVIAAVFLTVSPQSSAHAETRALLIGVWRFESPYIRDLKGPENDVAAMEALVRAEGATDVTVLRNADVTRTSVETALHALGLRSKPGDWIIVYYSGHGAEAQAAIKSARDGDKDQFLPLAKFDADDAERFIVDKDFYAWMARYVPASVQVLMMADACHSGTLNRSIDKRAFHFASRLAFRATVSEDTLAARPAPRFDAVLGGMAQVPEGIDRADLPNVIYFAAAQDDQLALETALPVEGAPVRGLLTYSFEQGLLSTGASGTGPAADLDGNGKVSVAEMAQYLDTHVRDLTAQRQEPRATMTTGKDALALFGALPAATAAPADAPLPAIYAAAAQARPLLAATGAPWRVAASANAADFVWDFAAGSLIRRSGDQVAQDVSTTAQLRGVMEKWDTLAKLRPLLDEARLKVRIGPLAAGARYAPGVQVNVGVKGQGAKSTAPLYLTVFDLAADGTVQSLYPAAGEGDGVIAAGATVPLVENRAVPPYGADHVIALLTPQPPETLRALLRTIEGQRASGRLVAPLRQALASAGAAGGLSVGELYTGR